MARTTASEVEEIIEVEDGVSLTPFITTANELVTEACTGTNGPSTAYSAARLELIERWLTAHFYSIRVPRVAAEQAGPVLESVQYKIDLGLDVTLYGQQAQILDTNGGLARIDEQMRNGGAKASMFWLGTDRDDY